MTTCAVCHQPITYRVYRDAAGRPRCEAHRDAATEAAQASQAGNMSGLWWMRGEEIIREKQAAGVAE